MFGILGNFRTLVDFILYTSFQQGTCLVYLKQLKSQSCSLFLPLAIFLGRDFELLTAVKF